MNNLKVLCRIEIVNTPIYLLLSQSYLAYLKEKFLEKNYNKNYISIMLNKVIAENINSDITTSFFIHRPSPYSFTAASFGYSSLPEHARAYMSYDSYIGQIKTYTITCY